ncbi:hypothetical protein EDD37DRAFT_510743 [Exophiala viscosa]|uniref:uncharacterized protein n=1 Tax=Exophiala viscosa TaxID=2486360 RepID=UPI002195AD7B|nr:hypothetical protein EDD37DRAFT_510743 [Exophiala viscosa]
MGKDQDFAIDSDIPEAISIARRPSRWTRLTRLINDLWILEIVSLAFSAVSLGAVVVVLHRYDGKPLRTWPYTLQITTVISFLGTICTSTLVMSITAALSQCKWNLYTRNEHPVKLADFQSLDAASRGPLGALRLIMSYRCPDLALMTAAVIIAGFALEPFVQQAVDFPSRFTRTNVTATIPVTTSYDDYASGEDSMVKTVDLPMKAAIYDGLFYTNVSAGADSIAAQCPTTNCTFLPYATLSMCSKCVNITNLIQQNCSSYEYDCTYHLPNGLSANDDEDPATYTNTTSELATSELANVSQFSVPFSGMGRQSIVPATFTAFECILYPCVNILTANVASGTLVETISASLLPDYQNSSEINLDDTDIVFTLPNDTLSRLQAGNPRQFSVAAESWVALKDYLSSILTGSTSGDMGPLNFYPTGDYQDAATALYTNYALNLGQGITNLAVSIGNQFRLYSPQQFATGTASLMETYVRVRWAWLLLPAVLEGATWIIFLAVCVVTRKRKVPAWKDSALAVMAWGVDKTDLRRQADGLGLDELEESDELDKIADHVFARMVKDDKGKWIGLKIADRTGTYPHARGMTRSRSIRPELGHRLSSLGRESEFYLLQDQGGIRIKDGRGQ